MQRVPDERKRRPGLRGRRWTVWGAAIVGALFIVPSASAHAVLMSSSPSNDTILEQTPKEITLGFNERVETAFGSIGVYDGGAVRVDSGSLSRPDDETVSLSVGKELARGTYTVTWRVVSADAHPVSGAFVFHVGEPSANPSGVAEEVLGKGTPQSVRFAFAVDRFLRFALLLLVAGGFAMLVSALSSASAAVRRTLAWAVAGLAMALVVVSVAGIFLQGALAGGFGLGKALDGNVFSSVMETRFGKIWMAQAVIAAIACALAVVAARRPDRLRSLPLGGAALLVSVGLVAMPALSGHASVSGLASQVADAVHVGAAAAWAGGLAFVLTGLILARGERWTLASTAVPRFSAIAFVSVGVLLFAGVINSYVQVRELHGFWDTTYGLVLLGKIALVLPVLALGAYNNRFAVPRLRAGITSAAERTRFLRAVGVELAIVVAVLGVTAVLVQEPPAKAAIAPSGPYATNTELGALSLNFVVDPAKAGPNEVHLTLLEKNGQPAEVEEATIFASLPSEEIGPLTLETERGGPGHYLVTAAVFPIAGDWQLRIEARRGEFESLTQTLSVPIRSD